MPPAGCETPGQPSLADTPTFPAERGRGADARERVPWPERAEMARSPNHLKASSNLLEALLFASPWGGGGGGGQYGAGDPEAEPPRFRSGDGSVPLTDLDSLEERFCVFFVVFFQTNKENKPSAGGRRLRSAAPRDHNHHPPHLQHHRPGLGENLGTSEPRSRRALGVTSFS